MSKNSLLAVEGHTSKGNQLKWFKDGVWYKADGFGYEGLAEAITSNIMTELGIDCVKYKPCQIEYNGSIRKGCMSNNFLNEGEELVPLEKLFRLYTGVGLGKRLARYSLVEDKIRTMVEEVAIITGLEEFGNYLSRLIALDAVFLNEDRHTNNIALIWNEKNKSWRFTPVFDMGLSLLSDTREDFPLELDIETCLNKVKGKPFSENFDEQLDAVEKIYGHIHLGTNKMNVENIVKMVMGEFAEYKEDNVGGRQLVTRSIYSNEEINRVEQILHRQFDKYRYLFQ